MNILKRNCSKNELKKLKIFISIVSILFIWVAFLVEGIIQTKVSNEEFLRADKNRYVIREVIKEDYCYYEVDLDKEKMAQRKDVDNVKRVKVSNIDIDITRIKKLINSVISDENNKTFTKEEQQELYRNRVYEVYSIKNFENEIYYIKNVKKATEFLKIIGRK